MGTGITVPDVIEVGVAIAAPDALPTVDTPMGQVAEVGDAADIAELAEPGPERKPRRGRRQKAELDITAEETQKMAEQVAGIADGVGAEQVQLSLFDADTNTTSTLNLSAPGQPAVMPEPEAAEPESTAPEPMEINITVTDAPAVKLAAPSEAVAEDQPQRTRKKAEPKKELPQVCAPETIDNRLDALRLELEKQEAHRADVEASKGSKGGISKFERLELAEKAVRKAQRSIAAEEKKLGTSCPSGTSKGGGVASQARPKKKESVYAKSTRSGTHPAVKIRNAARRDQKARATGRK